jgi:hypothetical protein
LRPPAPAHTQRLRHALREYFPAALEAFEDLDAPDALELLARAPDPGAAARLTIAQISAALKHARRRNIPDKAARIQAVLRGEHLAQPEVLTAAYAATTRAAVAVLRTLHEQLSTLHEQLSTLQGQVDAHVGRHPDAEIISSQPGLGPVLGARVLAWVRGRPAALRRCEIPQELRRHQPHQPGLRQKEGRPRPIRAQRPAHRRPDDPGLQRAQRLPRRPGLLRQLKARGTEHHAALRQLANRLVGILHGCLKTRTCYDEATAWPQHTENAAA